MKYRRNIGFGESIAMQMTDFVRSLQWPIDVLIPVPLGKKRLKERGYNQVALVARPLAYQLGFTYEPDALWKTRETRSQVGLTFPSGVKMFRMRIRLNSKVVKDKSVLIMDDVATTGSTHFSLHSRLTFCRGARSVCTDYCACASTSWFGSCLNSCPRGS